MTLLFLPSLLALAAILCIWLITLNPLPGLTWEKVRHYGMSALGFTVAFAIVFVATLAVMP